MAESRLKGEILGIALVCLMASVLLSGLTQTVNAENTGEFKATAYYCIYESEMAGIQTVTQTISGTGYTLKASFLFGGFGIAMQGTGRTEPCGDYIHYSDIGSGGRFVHINNPEEFTDEVKQRYTNLGITDFAGFGNLALTHPEQATYSVVSDVIGENMRPLIPWYSIAVDKSVIPLDTKGTLLFKTGKTPDGSTRMCFRADDTGGAIKGKHVDIYLGEGESALAKWQKTGGNRYVTLSTSANYGDGIGEYQGVKAYSNGEYTGTIEGDYQCVSFVKEFYKKALGMDTSNWRGNANDYYGTAEEKGLKAYPNRGTIKPQAGDILCFDNGGYGHVAIIMGVSDWKCREKNYIKIIEQNWHRNYACDILPWNKDTNTIPNRGSYQIQGWLRTPINAGLYYLREQQNPDGSWQNSVGITSMSALAFLNAGYTEDDPTVNKAIQYILDNKNADRSFGRETYDTASEYNLTNRSADRSFGGTYETSTAVWALVATHNPDYNDEITDAKDWLINAQYDEGEGATPTDPCYGGWRYGSSPNDGDLSNTQFALMALDAAYSYLGLEKPKPNDPDEWASKAIKFISRCQNRPTSNDQTWAHDDNQPSYDDGGFIYTPTGWSLAGGTKSYGSMAAAGIWSLRLCGVDVTDENERVQKGLNWLVNNEDCRFDDNPGHPYGQEHCFLYYYYMSLAKALVMCFEDDLICDDWYTALSIKLINLQHDDGYWVNSYTGHGGENIPEIATDFAILALQTKQPPAADLWMSIILASNATLTVYDPQGRYARLGDITIPGATFEIDGDGRQIVNLTELQAGKYRVELKGTADGDYSLTIEGYRDEEKTSSETFESTIKEGEYQKSDVLVTSMVGALTIIAEEPKDLLITDLTNVELVSADPTVTSINVTGLSLSEIDTTYKPAGVTPQLAYMINSTGAGSFTLRFTDILDASAIIVYKINTTNQWIEILDTTTTANTVTFTMEVGDPPVVFGFKGLPPIADANGPYSGVIEYIAVPITFDGTGSYDPDGTIVSYAWDLDNDGKFDDAFGATPTVSFTAPYSGNINLKVTDNNGATDTDTTTLTITKHSPPPNGIHGGLLMPPEQPQCYKGTSTIQGKGNFTIDESIQDWATAIDTTEHIEGTGEFEMDSKKVLNQAANPLNFYDPNFYYKKTMQFQGNATNRLISRDKFESSGIFGGTGTRINEYFDVSMIQKDESGSIKTISAPGSGQSHRFATMDDFSGIWGIHSGWQKICQKDIRHHQMFIGNFSVQKDLTFEREVVIP